MSSHTTRGVAISVEPQYLPEQSEPGASRFVWAYHILIHNQGEQTVKLINRYWHIMDARGKVEEVRGPGVVGKQPTLRPGEAFRYTSGVPLATPSGFMRGHYEMRTEGGEMFEAEIPAFSLDLPLPKGKPN